MQYSDFCPRRNSCFSTATGEASTPSLSAFVANTFVLNTLTEELNAGFNLRCCKSIGRGNDLSRVGKDAMPQADGDVVRNSELRRNATGRLGVLPAAEVSADHLHLADGKGDHALEHVLVVELRIFAIQFWFHCQTSRDRCPDSWATYGDAGLVAGLRQVDSMVGR